MIHFTVLPSDVIIIIMQHLSARDLAAMAQSCKLLHSLVSKSRSVPIGYHTDSMFQFTGR